MEFFNFTITEIIYKLQYKILMYNEVVFQPNGVCVYYQVWHYVLNCMNQYI